MNPLFEEERLPARIRPSGATSLMHRPGLVDSSFNVKITSRESVAVPLGVKVHVSDPLAVVISTTFVVVELTSSVVAGCAPH